MIEISKSLKDEYILDYNSNTFLNFFENKIKRKLRRTSIKESK